jgi:hypothetical protein
MNKVDCVTPTPSAVKLCTQITSRSQYLSEWYKNMTPQQREARLERQRLHNTLPGRKQAKKISKERLKEVRKNTLHQESIAMENPIYVPEPVWSTIEVSEPHRTTTSTDKWLISEVNTTPLYSPPDSVEMMEMDKDACSDVQTCKVKQRRRVPSWRKQILLTHQNMLFEECIGGKQKQTTKQSERDRANETQLVSQLTEDVGPSIHPTSDIHTQQFVDDSGNLQYC